MERNCKYPECPTLLSDHVRSEIVFCGVHQRELRTLKERLASENLPEEDIQFIFRHPKGCNCNQLSVHLKLNHRTISGYLQRSVIKGKKDERQDVWNIPQEEIERVIILVRNWITTRQAARITGVDGGTFLAYARQGYFGPYQLDLSENWAIRNDQLPQLKERFQAIKKRVFKQRCLPRFLTTREITPAMIARIIKCNRETVCKWIRKGQLPAKKKGKTSKTWWAIRRTDFIKFAQRAVAGEYPLWFRTKRALRQFLAQQNPP